MIDYHIHSNISGDSKISMRKMAEAAQSKGLRDICFTEHIDFDFPSEELDFSIDFDAYRQIFDETTTQFPSLRIRKGIEAGLELDSQEKFPSLLLGQDIDYIIGSLHLVFGYDPYEPSFWQTKDKQQIFSEYIRLVLETAQCCNFFDVIGHLGYISKFCPYENNLFRYNDYQDIIDILLKLLVQKGKGLEVNTNGLLMTSSTMPETPIIKRFFELGGEIITIGSDAHTKDIVGFRVQETLETLKTIGFEYVCAFDQHKPRFIPIP